MLALPFVLVLVLPLPLADGRSNALHGKKRLLTRALLPRADSCHGRAVPGATLTGTAVALRLRRVEYALIKGALKFARGRNSSSR